MPFNLNDFMQTEYDLERNQKPKVLPVPHERQAMKFFRNSPMAVNLNELQHNKRILAQRSAPHLIITRDGAVVS